MFIGDESGQWMLLSTNNETDDPTHEFDEIDQGYGTQEGFDNSGAWRQVRVDLAEFADVTISNCDSISVRPVR